MTIYLCGFMGCGKTTVGKIIAKKLGVSYFDSDDEIVIKEKMTIPEIFDKMGEPYFRESEAEVIKSFVNHKSVISCGGGAMLNAETAKAVSEKGGIIVFIDVPFENCYERIKGDSNRPIVVSSTKEQLLERYNTRYPVYLANSSVKIDGDCSPLEASERIISAIKFING
ncbi:MAG: shikimate kinase [Oscillospiraceae bacterium]|nr:shikimate kinase [Oscillospiraceae bacterium]